MTMFHEDLPSVAAILLADLEPRASVERLDAAMKAQRYRRWDQRLPRGYPAGPLEWIGLLIAPLDAIRGVVVIPSDIGHAFEIACWLSNKSPEQLVVAWRRLRGEEPVAKFLSDGAPRWKDGEDRDLEVGWHVPHHPPAETRLPSLGDLPPTAAACADLLRDVVRPFPKDLACRAGEGVLTYLERRSPLA